MRAVIQRVKSAEVCVDSRVTGSIGKGLLILVGVGKGDSESDISFLSSKIPELRIFEDESGKFNLSLKEIGGEMLVVSQFTLASDCRKGTRPSFDNAESPERARELHDLFVERIRQLGLPVSTGRFGAYMKVRLLNDGPVTFLIHSRKDT